MVDIVIKQLKTQGGLHWFPRSQVVAYLYYQGRVKLLEDQYAEADAQFTRAMALCHREAWTNKRLIMDYHLPIKMTLGKLVDLDALRRLDDGVGGGGGGDGTVTSVLAASASASASSLGAAPSAKRMKREQGRCTVTLNDDARTVLRCVAGGAASEAPVEGEQVVVRGMLEVRYRRLLRAARRGDMRAYLGQIEEHKEHFIQRGTYLVLESMQHIVYRNLLHRIYSMESEKAGFNKKRPTLSLTAVQRAIAWGSGDESLDLVEVECIVANLIARKLVKGVIDHSNAMLVLSPSAVPSKQAFPPLHLTR